MSAEQESDYTWALSQIIRVLPPNRQPSVIVTDCELALLRAIAATIPKGKTPAMHLAHSVELACEVHSRCFPFGGDGVETRRQAMPCTLADALFMLEN